MFFIYLSADFLGCFQILVIVCNGAMSIGIHISFQISVFVPLNKYPVVEFLDHMAVLFLIFKGNSILFSIATLPVYNPTNSAQIFPFSTSLITLDIVLFMIAIVTGVKGHHTMVAIWFSWIQ